jgi:hypothetical protein
MRARRMTIVFSSSAAVAVAAAILSAPTGAAQLASRPAEEWVNTLASAERLAALRIDDAVDIDKGFFPLIGSKTKQAGVANVQTVLGEDTDPKLPAADVVLRQVVRGLWAMSDHEPQRRRVTAF